VVVVSGFFNDKHLHWVLVQRVGGRSVWMSKVFGHITWDFRAFRCKDVQFVLPCLSE
jgi:hypothetical protein